MPAQPTVSLAPALRRGLDARAKLLVFGGFPEPRMLAWLRAAVGGDVTWVSEDAMPRRPVFDPEEVVGIVLLQGLMGHVTMGALTAAAKSAAVPFARANMPGRGSFLKALNILNRACPATV